MTTLSTLKQTPVEPTALEDSELKAGKLLVGLVREKQAWMLATTLLAAVALLEPFIWVRYLSNSLGGMKSAGRLAAPLFGGALLGRMKVKALTRVLQLLFHPQQERPKATCRLGYLP